MGWTNRVDLRRAHDLSTSLIEFVEALVIDIDVHLAQVMNHAYVFLATFTV